jgi:hypothetical protein
MAPIDFKTRRSGRAKRKQNKNNQKFVKNIITYTLTA